LKPEHHLYGKSAAKEIGVRPVSILRRLARCPKRLTSAQYKVHPYQSPFSTNKEFAENTAKVTNGRDRQITIMPILSTDLMRIQNDDHWNQL